MDGAKQTAARLGLDADRADFRCQDAGAAAAQLAAEGARPDVIVVDPPRKGCDEAALTAIAEMAPAQWSWSAAMQPPPHATPNG